MTNSVEFNCVYCKKTYKKQGWLGSHIMKKHEDDQLLERNMTFLRDNAQDLSTIEGAQNLSENPLWENNISVNSPPPSFTPRVANTVPQCPTARNYIAAKGKTLPASFLTTLLPPRGFLDSLSKSLEEEEEVPDLLQQFEEEICCYKCDQCGLSLRGRENLNTHTRNHHQEELIPPSQAQSFPILGDYLSSIENELYICTDLVKEQAVTIVKLLSLHGVNPINRQTTRAPIIDIEEDLTIRHHLKCDKCDFETDNNSQLNLHKSGKHSD